MDEISRTLAVPHLYLATGVNRFINENRQLNRDVLVWKQKYYEMFAKELVKESNDVIVHFFDDIDVKSLATMAQYITKNYKKALIFEAKVYDNVHIVVARNEAVDFDVEATFKEISDKYHLNGGGNQAISQGGGIYRDEIFEEIQKYVR